MNSSHTAKSCMLILLVALLCAERAQGLKCYNCLGVPLETSCNTTTCPYSDGFCVTQVAEVVDTHTNKVKSSMCFPSCPTYPENTEILGITIKLKTSCCKADLCNAAVPTGGEILGTTINVKTSCCKADISNAALPTGGCTWTMAGVLLFSLSSVLLQTLL
ncbi:lymphocyte antigen 6G-like [Mastomys coucha]|uniref:lymphocyte antigen 6G-like n=1 Tax=Mastomys coucha TaxID=35658 RepID=UPI00126239EA|nr:lymphocyte antigen 6G-like [Mastomys coucha]XP_031202172.1 lymphocyte antigen 6G-like [Mastomys coucha]